MLVHGLCQLCAVCRSKASKLLLRPFLSPALVQKVNEEFKQKAAAEELSKKTSSSSSSSESRTKTSESDDSPEETPSSPKLSPDMDWFNAFHQIPSSERCCMVCSMFMCMCVHVAEILCGVHTSRDSYLYVLRL